MQASSASAQPPVPKLEFTAAASRRVGMGIFVARGYDPDAARAEHLGWVAEQWSMVFNTNTINLTNSVPEPASLTALARSGLALLGRRR